MLLLLLVTVELPSEETRGFLTARLDTDGTLQTRIRFKGRGSILFGRIESDRGGILSGSGGFATPVFSLGPVYVKGMMREIRRPGCYLPGSEVYTEPPGVKLDSSLEGTKTLGAALYSPDGKTGGLCSIESGRLSWGMWGMGEIGPCVRIGAYAGWNGLFPGNQTQDEEWIADTPPFPGEELVSLAWSAEMGPRDKSAALCLFSSFTPAAPSGFAFRCSSKLLFSFLRLFGVCNLINEGFVTPEGIYPKDVFTAGGRAVFFPEYILTPDFDYFMKLGRKEIFPAPYRNSSYRLGIGCTFSLRPFNAHIGWEQRIQFCRLGELSGKDTFSLETGIFEGGPVSFGTEPELCIETDGARTVRLPLSVSLRSRKVRCRGKVQFSWDPEFRWKTAVRLTFKGKNREVFIKIEAETRECEGFPGNLYIQGGWQSSVTLPHAAGSGGS
jgi:hypothetical protein